MLFWHCRKDFLGYNMVMFTPQDIATIRKTLGLTATEFAYELGISENTVRRWEMGDRHPRYKMMEKLNKLNEKAQQSSAAS